MQITVNIYTKVLYIVYYMQESPIQTPFVCENARGKYNACFILFTNHTVFCTVFEWLTCRGPYQQQPLIIYNMYTE